jgi:hypothetical protein
MNKRTKKSLPVPEVTYAVEVLCFDCARFYTATVIGWDKETFLALRDSPDGLYALTKALERPPCPCCGKPGSITSLGHLEACRLHCGDFEWHPSHFVPLDPQP